MKIITIKHGIHESSTNGRFIVFQGNFDLVEGEEFICIDPNLPGKEFHDAIAKGITNIDELRKIHDECSKVELTCRVIYNVDSKIRVEVL